MYDGCTVVGVDVDELDITSSDAVDEFFSIHKAKHRVQLAAMTNVDGCEGNEDSAYQVNASGPETLGLPARGTVHVFCTSLHRLVFAGKVSKPYVETDEPAPIPPTGGPSLQVAVRA